MILTYYDINYKYLQVINVNPISLHKKEKINSSMKWIKATAILT